MTKVIHVDTQGRRQRQVEQDIATLQAMVTVPLAARVTTLEGQVADYEAANLPSRVATLETQVAALRAAAAPALPPPAPGARRPTTSR